ncbi:MAG: phosphoenolpyruvate--protein phosphotransferase [Alphaproteobacteria bacterium]
MTERRFAGKPAAPGVAIGPLVRLEDGKTSTGRRRDTPAEERAALDAAIATAMADLEALAAVASGDGADILAFQIEMLSDPALIEEVLPLIEGGEAAGAAWTSGLADQIATYEAADDDYFRARASDLLDLRDRVLRTLDGVSIELPDFSEGTLLLAEDLAPSLFLALAAMKPGGIALTRGSASSHVAILARGRGLPMVIGLGLAAGEGGNGEDDAILDGDAGLLLRAPSQATLKRYRSQLAMAAGVARRAHAIREKPAATADGTRIELMINVDDPAAVDDQTLRAADGVGLLRSEFLLIGRSDLPDEETHYRHYRDLQRRLAGKPLIVRTLDIGGDKPLAGLDLPVEKNPFLGLRGIRLALERPDLLIPQLRALLRVAAEGPLQVMLPMVTVQAEIDQTQALMAEGLASLKSTAMAAAMPGLGIMVETPAAAIAADSLDAAFYSIGSNDLIQYVMAAARDGEGRVAALLDPGHPAIERLIRRVVEHGRTSGREVSLCGDMASDPAWLPLLLGAGLRKLSVAPAAFDRIKLALADIEI